MADRALTTMSRQCWKQIDMCSWSQCSYQCTTINHPWLQLCVIRWCWIAVVKFRCRCEWLAGRLELIVKGTPGIRVLVTDESNPLLIHHWLSAHQHAHHRNTQCYGCCRIGGVVGGCGCWVVGGCWLLLVVVSTYMTLVGTMFIDPCMQRRSDLFYRSIHVK